MTTYILEITPLALPRFESPRQERIIDALVAQDRFLDAVAQYQLFNVEVTDNCMTAGGSNYNYLVTLKTEQK